MVKYLFPWLLLSLSFCLNAGKPAKGHPGYKWTPILTSKTNSHSRSQDWKPGKGVTLEVSGLEVMADGRIIIAIRKGDVLILEKPDQSKEGHAIFKKFATGLHEPLGIVRRGDSYFVVQRSELTELKDTDKDDVADQYKTISQGWELSGNYHEYAFGPKFDKNGDLWVTLNVGIGKRSNKKTLWRGWGGRVTMDGKFIPECFGMRSPCGIGANLAGDMFFTDQQGNYVPTNTLHHMRRGVFHGHADSIPSMKHPDSPIKKMGKLPHNQPYPKAVQMLPELVPPAVWFPYFKMGRSTTDIVCDTTKGKFGPFAGQLFVGEFTHSGINRVYMEKVNGVYQGACFPFMKGFPAAVVRMCFSQNGAMFAGMTNRGWNSTGGESFGLTRLDWNKKPFFEIQSMQARKNGFRVVFTENVDKKTALNKDSYTMQSYTYNYSSKYGGDEILKKKHAIDDIKLVSDNTVDLIIDDCRKLYVHELICKGVRNTDNEPLIHPDAYYTLNEIPRK